MVEEPLIAELKKEAMALKQSSTRLALLADRLPKHGATLGGLSRTLLRGSQFIQEVVVHITHSSRAA